MNILVVDDEYLARESLVKPIRQCGCATVYEAADGVAALDIIGRCKPEIVVADIRMPGMDGIELLRKVKAESADPLFIFLSGYDYFEYAQQALNLGAFHYLLKPFKEEELVAVLQKALRHLAEQKRQRKGNAQFSLIASQGLDLMRRQFILELLTQDSLGQANFAAKAGELNIRFSHRNFCVLIISIASCKQPAANQFRDGKDVFLQNIEAVVRESLTALEIDAFPFSWGEGLGFLVNFAAPGQDPHSPLYGGCEKLKQKLAAVAQNAVTIGIGTVVNEPVRLPEAYQTALKAIELKLVKGANQIFVYEGKTTNGEDFGGITHKTEQELYSCFEHCEKSGAMAVLEKLYAPFRTVSGGEIEKLKKLNLQLILLIYKILNQMEHNAEALLGDEFNLYNQVNSCAGFDAMLEWFAAKLEVCFEAIRSNREKGHKKLIEKAKHFIRENINRDLTLEAVAAHVHLSANYFSKLFRQEVGENFVDYVAACRIGLAKELLKEGIYKANQVCKMAGFHDVKHFYKVFKKLTGFTPGEYKEL